MHIYATLVREKDIPKGNCLMLYPSAYYIYNQNIARAYFIADVHWPHIEIEEVKDTERLGMGGGGSEG